MGTLQRMKIAILVTNGFEQDELLKPRQALQEAGAKTEVVSPNGETIRGWNHGDWGITLKVDQRLSDVKPGQYDGLLLPGGVINPDKLRMDRTAVEFVRSFFTADKPVATICHGPWSIIEAGVARGRKIASWPSLKTDLRNAGAEWIDEEAVVDKNLVSARNPDDIPAFNRAMIEHFSRSAPTNPAIDTQASAAVTEDERDPRHHAQKIRHMLDDIATHTREDVDRVTDPRAKVLFETTTETLNGLMKAYDDFELKKEEAWG